MKIYQGDSYPIPVSLRQSDYVLTPDMVEDIRITVGEALSYEASAGEVVFDYSTNMWYFRPSQTETLALDPDDYQVMAKIKYSNENADVVSVPCGKLTILDATDTEEI